MAYGVDKGFGFQPRRMLSGATFNNQTSTYLIASGYAQDIFNGDPVYYAGNGRIGRATAGNGNPILGIFTGVKYMLPGNNNINQFTFSPYWPANTVVVSPGQPAPVAYAMIIDDPNVVYDVQAATQIDSDQLSLNANFLVPGGPVPPYSYISGQSYLTLDSAAAAPTATFQFKILGYTPQIENTPDTPFNNVEVIINNHPFKGGTGTVGVA